MPEDTAHVTPNDVYRALSPTLGQKLHDYCKVAKEHPASVLADALALHFDELDGAVHDPTIVALAELAEVRS